MKKIIYIANARIPTEKAHGYQICKMCEAFSETGAEIKLLHPGRRLPGGGVGKDLFDYYGINQTFEVYEVPNLDIFMVEKYLPASLFTFLFFLHSLLWGAYAAWYARRFYADLYYSREITTVFWLALLRMPAALELHTIPGRVQKMLLRLMAGRKTLRRVFVLTRFIRERLTEFGFKREGISIVPDGVDLRLFEELPDMETCRQKTGLPAQKPIIGYIGRFKTMGMEKGIPELIRAVADCYNSGQNDIMLLCVGGPRDPVKQYLAIAAEAGLPRDHVRFLDRVPNQQVPQWIRACTKA